MKLRHTVAGWVLVAGCFNLVAVRSARAEDTSALEGLLSEPIVSSASKQAEDASSAPALSTSLTAEDLTMLLDLGERFLEIAERPIKKVPTLRGKTVVNLFYEPSTRTRTSFEIAEKRLSADTLNIAVQSSSVLKGETLADTAMNIEAMSPDMIVLRHASSGACHLLSRICRSRIIASPGRRPISRARSTCGTTSSSGGSPRIPGARCALSPR